MDASHIDVLHVEDATSEPVTRVKRTYGRKKETADATLDVGSVAASTSRARSDPASSSSVLEDMRPSTSTLEDASSGAFGWRKKLAAIDEQFKDDDDARVSSSIDTKRTHDHSLKDSSSAKSVSTEGDSFSGLDDSLLVGSLLPLTSSQSDPPSPAPVEAKQSRKKTTFIDSDLSDGECVIDAKESSPMSPEFPHSINTPKTRSSTSPASSDGENERRPSSKILPIAAGSGSDERSGSEDVAKRTSVGSKNRRKSGTGKAKEKADKIKKLSKKEEKESKKAHARIMADQKISVTKRAEQFTINDLLGKIQHTQIPRTKAQLHAAVVSSDPIQEFTSSPMLNPADVPLEHRPAAGPSTLRGSSDEEMPNARELLKRLAEKKQKGEADAQRRKSLAVAKRRALEVKAQKGVQTDSDDDDLEVVEESIHVEKHPKQLKVTTDYEKRLANVAGFRVKRHSLPGNLEGTQGEKVMKLAAKSAFSDHHERRVGTAVDHRSLQSAMLNKASKQSMQLTREKEEEWQRRGGRLTSKQRAALTSEPFSIKRLAGELAVRRPHVGHDGEDGPADTGSASDASRDGDWIPELRGSTSPQGDRSSKGSGEEEELEGNEANASDVEFHNENVRVVQQLVDTEDEEEPARKRQSRRTVQRAVISDSENEGGSTRRSGGRVLIPDTSMVIDDLGHRGSISSAGESAPDEENKENDTRLMFDNGDDKENIVVPRHSLPGRPRELGGRQSSNVFDLEEGAARLSMSPSANAENTEARRERRPLQSKKVDEIDDPFTSRSPSVIAPYESPKSFRISSTSTSPKMLRPAFGGGVGGFSQFFNDDEGVIPADGSTSPGGFLQPAFGAQTSQKGNHFVHPSFEPKPMELGDFSDMFSPEAEKPRIMNRMQLLSNAGEFSLTLDTKLQPALEVTTQVRRKADAIFEKEQDFVLEEANNDRPQSKRELYITENGLLTQTKPEGSTPLVYRSWTPSQKSAMPGSQGTAPPTTTQRLPLSTLSFTSDTTSPSQHRLSRLVKGKKRSHSPQSESPPEDLFISRPALGHRTNALIELLKGAKQQTRKKKILGRSEFVEGEALESDEDELFGFGGAKKNDEDDESGDDDPDAVVEGLVDDAVMDPEQIAREKVIEKVNEQLDQDDAALQKYHQAAIEGKFRGKRRGGGIALDDSDSDEEDEDARRLRLRMHKKRRIEGDTLEDLSKDVKSRVYYEAYQKDVQEDDNDDFAHLAEDDMDAADEDDENEPPVTVSTSEIQAKLREAARLHKGKEKEYHVFDPEDVDWAQPVVTSDDEFEVKEVEDRPKKPVPRRPVFGQMDTMDLDDSLPRQSNKWDDAQTAQLAAWKKEQSGRNLGTGGARGAVTATGHGSKGGRGGVPMSRTSQYAAGGDQPERRKVMKDCKHTGISIRQTESIWTMISNFSYHYGHRLSILLLHII
ncbi:MRC1-like domain-containing protein [Phellopilus nigrolimitatus]|nr:MRC1-like domain-containing protein [Phellopilus nigrolimitatus]